MGVDDPVVVVVVGGGGGEDEGSSRSSGVDESSLGVIGDGDSVTAGADSPDGEATSGLPAVALGIRGSVNSVRRLSSVLVPICLLRVNQRLATAEIEAEAPAAVPTPSAGVGGTTW